MQEIFICVALQIQTILVVLNCLEITYETFYSAIRFLERGRSGWVEAVFQRTVSVSLVTVSLNHLNHSLMLRE